MAIPMSQPHPAPTRAPRRARLAAVAAFALLAPAVAGQTNIALNRSVSASTAASATYAAAKAVDGNLSTAWRSNSEANPWIYVDLGTACAVTRVTLNWSTNYGKAYAVQTSADAVGWTTARSLSAQNGATDDITGLTATGRYLRIFVTQRSSTRNGVWLSELAVYGTPPDATPPSAPGGLAASSVTQTSFTLSWSPSTDNVGVTGYEVLLNGSLLTTVTGTSATLTGLSAATAHPMSVRARDAAGNRSPASSPLTVMTAAADPASTLVDFEAWPLNTLPANPYADNSGYRFTGRFSGTNGAADPLYVQTVHNTRGLMNGNWSSMITIDRTDGASFDITSLDHHGDPWDASCDATVTGHRSNGTTVTTTYTAGASFATLTLNWTGLTRLVIDFAGGANNSYGIIDNVRLSAGTHDTIKPGTPASLAWANLTPSSFTLSWSPSTDNVGVASYDVYRNGTLLANLPGTSLPVSGLAPSTSYVMTVAAKDAAGNASPASTPLTVTTLAATTTGRRNSIGINLANPGLDWGPDKPFADAMRAHRQWIRIGGTPNDPEPPLDADHWPATDARCLVWAGLDTRDNHGTYRLSFTGQATVATSAGTLSALAYDAASNTTSGTLTIADAANADLYLTFTNTRRTASSAANTGVTQVRLMRPLTPGNSQSHPATALFTDAFLAQLAPFSTLRSLGWVAVNWNQDSLWSDRTLMRHARQSPPTGGKPYGWEGRGAAYESLITLANTTRKDVWLTVPHKADADYMTRLALLFKNGSDGVNPYTAPQANPVFPPLDPALKLYVEYSNEIWNDQFSQTGWVYAQARNNSAVKFDGKTDPAQYQYLWGMRFKAVRTVELSNAFRAVFGGEMMARVRPVISFQKGYIDRTHQTLTFMDAYYNKRDSRSGWADPHPVNHFLYGAGGSFYWYTDNSPVTLNSIWTNGQWDATRRFTDPWGNPGGYYDQVTADAAWARQFGLAFVNYEGDMHPTFQGGDEAVIQQMHTGTWDARMMQNTLDHLNVLNRSDLEVGCLLNLNGLDGSTWAVRNTRNPANSPQLEALQRFNAATPLAVDYRNAPPFVRPGAAFDTREWDVPALTATGTANLTANAAFHMSYAFHTPHAGSHAVTVNYATTAAATFAVEVDGRLVATFTPGSTAGVTVATPAMSVTLEADRLHAVRLVALAGTLTVHSVAVAPATVTSLQMPAARMAPPATALPALFPNPAAHSLQLTLPVGSRHLEVHDLAGRLLRRKAAAPGRSQLDVSALPAGPYLLTIHATDGGRTTLRFFKE